MSTNSVKPTSVSKEELEDFADRFFVEWMDKLHAPGAAFALVKDGDIVLSKGYGYASMENRARVNPETTVFRVGSISKLFTATALMQLHERRQLSLEDDVNKHLASFKIEQNYDRPVTIANLLTHTGGFSDHFIGQHARNISELKPLGEYLAAKMPPRAIPPGEFISYNDHGMALAGHAAENVAQIPLAEYIQQNILNPLDMKWTSFEQPPPADLERNLAIGYDYRKGSLHPYRYDYVNTFPSAGLVSTVNDIAKFMIAHLQKGRYGSARILMEETADLMHKQQATHHPRLRGRTYGFGELLENGQRAIFHDGGMPGFNSRLVLIPEHSMGFFVTWNNNNLRLKLELAKQVFNLFFPTETRNQPHIEPVAPKNNLERFKGHYKDNIWSKVTLEKLITLLEQIEVGKGKQGTIAVGPAEYAEIEKALFKRTDGDAYIAFRQMQNKVTHMFIGAGSYEKVSRLETRPFQLGLTAFFALVFLSAVAANTVAILFQVAYIPVIPAILSLMTSLLNLVFLGGVFWTFMKTDRWQFMYGVPGPLHALLVTPLISAFLTFGLPIAGVFLTDGKIWSILGAAHYTLITFTSLAFLLFLNYWNLLAPKEYKR